jgi:hypothetical protein
LQETTIHNKVNEIGAGATFGAALFWLC